LIVDEFEFSMKVHFPVLVLVICCTLACSPSKRMLQPSNALQTNLNILEKIDSLIGNYSDTPEECIQLLALVL